LLCHFTLTCCNLLRCLCPAANIKVLVYSNVETFITFRSSTPLVLCIFDYLFLGRELPGKTSLKAAVFAAQAAAAAAAAATVR
jgi:hypothetical protein